MSASTGRRNDCNHTHTHTDDVSCCNYVNDDANVSSHFAGVAHQWTSRKIASVCVWMWDRLFTSFPCLPFSLSLSSPSPPSLPLPPPPLLSLPPSLHPLHSSLFTGVDNHLESILSNWHALAPLPLECILYWHQLPSKCPNTISRVYRVACTHIYCNC